MAQGHLRQRGKDRWQLIVPVGTDPVTGRYRYVRESFRGTKREAQNALNELLVRARAAPVDTRTTLSELLERWYAMKADGWSPGTAREHRRIIDNVICPYFGKTKATDVTPAVIDAFYAELASKGARTRPATAEEERRPADSRRGAAAWKKKRAGLGGGPLKASSIRKVHSVLRAALQQGVKWDLLSRNAAALASPPPVQRAEITIPTTTQIAELYRTAVRENPVFAFYLRLAAATGARRGELCGLRWSDFDEDTHEMRIQRSVVLVDGGTKVKPNPKTADSARRITLDPETWEMLDEFRDLMEERAGRWETRLVGDPFLFSNKSDCSKQINPSLISHDFGRLRAKSGIEGVRLHDIRHYVATTLLRRGTYVRTVSERIGHSSPTTTLRVYSQWVKDDDEKAASTLGTELAGVGSAGRRGRK
jgi:integrase